MLQAVSSCFEMETEILSTSQHMQDMHTCMLTCAYEWALSYNDCHILYTHTHLQWEGHRSSYPAFWGLPLAAGEWAPRRSQYEPCKENKTAWYYLNLFKENVYRYMHGTRHDNFLQAFKKSQYHRNWISGLNFIRHKAMCKFLHTIYWHKYICLVPAHETG